LILTYPVPFGKAGNTETTVESALSELICDFSPFWANDLVPCFPIALPTIHNQAVEYMNNSTKAHKVLGIRDLSMDFEVPSLDSASDSDRAASPSDSSSSSSSSNDSKRHDSARTSICSNDTDRSSNSSATTSSSTKKSNKRVRFQESVCCSYYNADLDPPRPEPTPMVNRRASFMTRSWQRITKRNFSGELDLQPRSSSIYTIHAGSSVPDITELGSIKPAKRSSFVPGRSAAPVYTIEQPLRESAGRRYDGTQTTVNWKAKPCVAKGDWNDLLGSRPKPTRMMTY
jgi:hypothetical protein